MNDKPAPELEEAPAEDPRVADALEEYLAALESGVHPDRKRLLERHPEIAERLSACLEGLDFLHGAATRIQADSSASGSLPPRTRRETPLPQLEDFRILREVGRGGMGIVFEAEQRSLNRRVALKVLTFGAALDPRHLQRFRNEAQAAAQLQHPHIVPVYSVGFEHGVHFYAMRFIDGEPLSARIRARQDDSSAERKDTGRPSLSRADAGDAAPVPPLSCASPSPPAPPARVAPRDKAYFHEAARLGIEAAEALEHAHQQGVVHRDVKPANLLLDREGHLWVADFGLARHTADAALTMTGDLLGTLRYMSPEQASARHGLVDHRTDIYALGATLYELLTLRPVFRGSDRRDLLQQILHDDPTPPSRVARDIPRDLETILLKALSKDVGKRYATAQEMADDLRRFQEGKPVQARRPTLRERAAKWARRHQPAVGAAAALLVLSVLGLVAGTVAVGRERGKAEAAYAAEAEARRTEAEARRTEAEARKTEAKARSRAEMNFHQARQLVDYIAELAFSEMADEPQVARVRRKLLKAALAYYQDFLDQGEGGRLTREELLRGRARIAALLEVSGRPEDAEAAWGEVRRIALTFGEGEGTFRLHTASNKLRLLRLPTVQADLRLRPAQALALADLEARQNDPAAPTRLAVLERQAVALLDESQRQRLDQLLFQQAGFWAFADPAVVQAMALTPEQRADIESLMKESSKPGNRAQREKAAKDRILSLLDAEQKKRIDAVLGTPFGSRLPPADFLLTMGKMSIQLAPASRVK